MPHNRLSITFIDTLRASVYFLISAASGRTAPVHMDMSKLDTTSYALHHSIGVIFSGDG